MRTLQIGSEWFPERAGGLPRYYFDLFHAARRRGLGFRGLVVGSKKVSVSTQGQVEGFCEVNSPLWLRLVKARRALKQAIKNYDPDVIVSHFALYAIVSLGLTKKPLIVHFHGPWAMEGRVDGSSWLAYFLKWCIEKVVYDRAKAFIVLSEAFAQLLCDQYGVQREKVHVIRGSVDEKYYNIMESRATAREIMGWPASRMIILSVRRLVRRMGLENLVSAMTDVVRRYPDVLLLIGGKGHLEEELKVLIKKKDLHRNVLLLGFIADEQLALAYRAADLSVVPSIELEGFGLIAAESLAVGTPVLVTPVGGLPEVVEGLTPNLNLEGCERSDISSALIEVLSGRRSLPSPTECREFAAKRFCWQVAAREIEDVYRKCANCR